MNYKTLRDWHCGFHDYTTRRHASETRKQSGFMGGFIFGERGKGKCTYTYKCMAKVYYTMGGYNTTDQETDAYKEALKYMIYEPRDFLNLTIYNKIHYVVTIIACLDDASMHFGNMMHMINPKLYNALLGETATVRTAITGFLITAPKRSHVAKFLRDYDDFKGEALIDEGPESATQENWNRKIRFYQWRYYPDEVKYRIHIPFQDKYSCYIPDEHYLPYIKKKRFFEIKHDIELAINITPETRAMIIENKENLPEYPNQPRLKDIVDGWERKEIELQKDQEKNEKIKKMKDADFDLKVKKFEEKISNAQNIEEKIENL